MPSAEELAGGQPPQIQIAPGAEPQGGDIEAILQALEQALSQSLDQEGYIDLDQLATVWNQIAQQMGVTVPFETILDMIKSNPAMIQPIIEKLGIIGIIANGVKHGGEELSGMGSGAMGAPQTGGL